MYEQLQQTMPQAYFYYGPVTREQAFNVPVQSWAAPVGNDWYIGTNVPQEAMSALNIPRPAHLDEPVDVETTTEQPSA